MATEQGKRKKEKGKSVDRSSSSATWLFAFFLLPFAFCLAPCSAATLVSPSVSYTDVSNTVASAVSGDTVQIPAGSANWTNTLNVTKAITIQGLTTLTGPSSAPIIDRQTVINNDIPSGHGTIFNLNVPATNLNVVRITGVSIVGNLGNGFGGMIEVQLSTPNFRVDHCEFVTPKNNYCLAGYNTKGLIDHNAALNTVKTFCDIRQSPFGDESYAAPLTPGSIEAIYVEDNYVFCSASKVQGLIDSQGGARYVIRYNTTFNAQFVTHGTESGGRVRGPRWWEIYNNTVTSTLPNQQANGALFRGGTGVMFSNIVTGKWGYSIRLVNYRDNQGLAFLWGGADGLNAWDINDTTDQTGNGLGGGPNGLYASGTHVGGTNSTTLTVAGTPWTPHQWIRYTVKNLDRADLNQSVIIDNTANTLTYATSAPTLVWNPGDDFTIRRVLNTMDHIGSGQSDLLTGNPPTPHWLNQIREPAYFWSNPLNSNPQSVYTEFNLVQNLDYYTEQAGFNGSVGIGVGTIAARPSSGLTAGVGYWATDESKFYKATGPTTWALYYQPFTYPHPLISGSVPSPPAAPSSLTATTVDSSHINLSWTDNSNNEEVFSIERKITGGNFATIATVTANSTSYADTALSPSTQYFYRVRAFNQGGYSAYSNEANATTNAVFNPPPRGRRVTPLIGLPK